MKRVRVTNIDGVVRDERHDYRDCLNIVCVIDPGIKRMDSGCICFTRNQG